MSENVFDRHPFDDGLTHAAHLKVGGLEPPCAPAAGERDAAAPAAGAPGLERQRGHAGDCSSWGGPICDCGWLRWRVSNGSEITDEIAEAWARHLAAIDTIHGSLRRGAPEEKA